MSTQKASITKLKKSLTAMSQKELVSLVVDLTQKFSPVNEYVSIMQNGEEQVLEKHKTIVGKEFSPEYMHLPKFRLSVARKAVADFKKISNSPVNVADLMVFYVECGVKGTNAFGCRDDQFYNSMESMYESAFKYIVKNDLIQKFESRMEKIVHDTKGMGWGFHDVLYEIHERFGKHPQ